MRYVYSLYDAKAKLSEILRRVRQGDTITVTYHGEAVAEIRPIGHDADEMEKRLSRLAARGVVARSAQHSGKFSPIARRPGALKRFLSDRNA